MLINQILADGDLKPQAKQLQARTEYLMKVLRKLCDTSGLKVCWKLLHFLIMCNNYNL